MSRYIDADALKKEVEDSMERNPQESGESGNLRSNHRVEHKHFMRLICSQPTADVEPVRHAHWVGIEYDSYADGNTVYYKYECSECGSEISTEDPPEYCCDCGAKMDGETEFCEDENG